MILKGKNILVIGAGISGKGAITLLNTVGANPILFDQNKEQIVDGINAKIILGELEEKHLLNIDIVVVSPGVPKDASILEPIKEKNIPIWSEIELAYHLSPKDIIAITGTNGKTTTTALVGEIMKAYYESVFVVGNIGKSYTLEIPNMREDSKVVAEISSFQLETIVEFHPKISAILNVTPDHLDRHKTMECYQNTKALVNKNQTKDDVCVLNYDDEFTRTFGEHCRSKVVYFSVNHELQDGFYCKNDSIYVANSGVPKELLHVFDMHLLGNHNVENVMAAIAITHEAGVPMERIIQSVCEFRAVEHRIEYVDTIRNIEFFNDSKGTNTDAAIKAVCAMRRPTVLIAGGYDKNSEYDEWILSFNNKVKCLVLLGQTREKIKECAMKHGFTNIIVVDTLKDAVTKAYENAENGDAILLSPACASWGMFRNYEERGSMFKQYVKNLEE
ncbi:MAG: UDP-N-acetylmuramoyl-L-alanine--D-glutamate ligase [Lachnospiraceae bacterium]